MEVKTKFNSGDTAWIFKDNALEEVMITHIIIRTDKNQIRIYNYFHQNDWLPDEDMYKSKNEFFQKNFKTEAKKEAIAFANWLQCNTYLEDVSIETKWEAYRASLTEDKDTRTKIDRDIEQLTKQTES